MFLNSIIKKNGVQNIERFDLSFFDFIFKTIVSQQISNKAANTIWKRIKSYTKIKNKSLSQICDDHKINELKKKLGISERKLANILEINRKIKKKEIDEKVLKDLEYEKVRDILIMNKGLGEWTCQMVCIFYFNKKNIWPISDLIIKKTTDLINKKENEIINFKKTFSPYLSILAIHLWKIKD